MKKIKSVFSVLILIIFFSFPQLTFAAELSETEGPEESAEEESGAESETSAAAAAPGNILWPETPSSLTAESFILMENNSGSILTGSNYDDLMYPASTTKILTCLIALENCSLDETVTFSSTAVDIESDASNIGMVAGEQLSMKDCLYGLMVASANECGNAIAEHIAGSISAFAEMMNERAEEIGALHSHFTNPHGLYDEDHYTTAYDLCLIAREAYRNSTFVDIISHSTYTIGPTNKDPNERTLTTTVSMINSTSDAYNPAVIGGKTGYLNEAGRCLVVFAEQNDMTVISVVLKAGYYDVFSDTQSLLDYAFNNFAIKNISEEEQRFSFASNKAKVYIDNTASILSLDNLGFEDLDSSIIFAEDMDDDEYYEALETAGILDAFTKDIYAAISYSYLNHYLGEVYVLTDSSMTFSEASFVQVRYIGYKYVISAIIIIILLMIITGRLAHIRRSSYVQARRDARNRHRQRRI